MSKDGNGETTIYYYRDNPRLIKERDDLAAKLALAKEALRYCTNIHFPPKAVAGKDFAQWALENNCKEARIALSKIEGGEGEK